MPVFDPKIELKAEFTGVSLSAGEYTTKDVYEVSPNEVLEVYRMEIIPPVDTSTGTIKKLREVTLLINGEEYPHVHPNSVMLPMEHPNNAGIAIDLGVPVLHSALIGRQPSAIENTTIKLKEGDTLAVKATADESISQDFTVRLIASRVRGADELRRQAGASYTVSFNLNGDIYSKPAVPIRPDTFDRLPGGKAQEKPAIYPWIIYARNKKATTANQWYSFDYPEFVTYEWQKLHWNLVRELRAYLIKYLGVMPNTNSKAVRFYIEGRETNPEFTTRPLPEENFFYPAMFYDVSVNAELKRAGPVAVEPPRLFHKVKGGVQIIDNGTSIPANGVELHVYGVLFELGR